MSERIKELENFIKQMFGDDFLYDNNNEVDLMKCACLTSDYDFFEEYIDLYLDLYPEKVNYRSESSRTVIMEAVYSSSFSENTFEIFLKHKANLNLQDDEGETMLHYTIFRLRGEYFITKLLQNHANVNLQNQTGQTALMYAVSQDHFDNVKSLIEHGANLDLQDENKNVALFYVFFMSHGMIDEDILNLLLENGSNVNLANNQGKTVIMLALKQKSIYCVHKLIQYGANLNQEDNKGRNAIIYAFKYDMIDLLIKSRKKIIYYILSYQNRFDSTYFWRSKQCDYKILINCFDSFETMIRHL